MSGMDDDFRYLQGAVGSLESYLLSDELYWPLGGKSSPGMVSSRLSLGALLLTAARLKASADDPEVSAIIQKMDDIRSQWRVHWENKAVRELGFRLNLWQNAMADFGDATGQDQGIYKVEVRNRVMIELLQAEAGKVPSHELSRINGLDLRLRARFIPGEFIWETALEPIFPQDKFWYLYGQIRG